MKVRELINELSKYDSDMEVRFMDYESGSAEEISDVYYDQYAVFREERRNNVLIKRETVLLS